MAKKATKPGVKKIGIYLPEERVKDVENYKARMNFSAVFWSAFDFEKRRLDSLPDGDEEMQKIIDRLSKSKRENEKMETEDGRNDGIKWASEQAEYCELMALQAQEEVDAESVQQLFKETYDDFWGHVRGIEHAGLPSEAYAQGFIEAAIELFRKVKSKIV